MTAQLFQFKQRPVKGTRPRKLDLPRWFCNRCDSDEFRLYESGTINCAHCHELILGITVEKT